MSQEDFVKIYRSKHSILSFNNFLSTSTERDTALAFAESSRDNLDTVGVLLELHISPTAQSTHFASLNGHSYYPSEKEVLFAMHSIFRIGAVHEIQEGLWHVQLNLVRNDDKELCALIDQFRTELLLIPPCFSSTELNPMDNIQKEDYNEAEDFRRALSTHQPSSLCVLGALMLRLGQFLNAKEVYEMALSISSNEQEKNASLGSIHHQLGVIYMEIGDFYQSFQHLKESIAIYSKLMGANHYLMSTSYAMLGRFFFLKGKFDESLPYYVQALNCKLKWPHFQPEKTAQLYNNIGILHLRQNQLSEAMKYFELSLRIKLDHLPPTHPTLAVSYNNIGGVSAREGDFDKALYHYKKAAAIQIRSLPSMHPELATCHANLAVCERDYNRALEHAEQVLTIARHCFTLDDPRIQSYQFSFDHIFSSNQADFLLAREELRMDIQRTIKRDQHHPRYIPDVTSTHIRYLAVGIEILIFIILLNWTWTSCILAGILLILHSILLLSIGEEPRLVLL